LRRLWGDLEEILRFFEPVAENLHSIWTGQSLVLILALPTVFSRELIMYGPGRYVPDPTEGITNVDDLPVLTMEYIGIDVHTNHSQTCLDTETGAVLPRLTSATL
jgi:hypothetical protein